MDGVTIGALLCTVAIGALIGAAIGAVLLRATIGLFNRAAGAAGPPAGVPNPPFVRAMWIVVATGLVTAGVGYLIGLAAGAGPQPDGAQGSAPSLSAAAGLVVGPVMLTLMLPTRLWKALLVTFLFWLIAMVAIWSVAVLLAGVGPLAVRHG